MKRLFFLLTMSLLLGGVLCLPGCASDDDEGVGPKPEPTVLGTYEFDGEEYRILSVMASSDDFYRSFSFSPLESTAPRTTYAVFALRLYWLGCEVNVQDVDHNDDYIFIYEDPLRFYSQYRQLQSGTFLVRENRTDNYTVKLDVVLPDGTPFKMDFTGDFR